MDAAPSPSLADLEAQLDVWQRRRVQADYTDSFAKMQAEKAECDKRIASIEAQIAAFSEKQFECPQWPSCGCPDGAVRSDCPWLTGEL